MTCHAVQMSDQMVCGQCGLQWDVNDPEPPECVPNEGIARHNFDGTIEIIGSPKMPVFDGLYKRDTPSGIHRTEKGFVVIQHSHHDTSTRFTHYSNTGVRIEEIEVALINNTSVVRRRRIPKYHFWSDFKVIKNNLK
jgi:hypothetical protein